MTATPAGRPTDRLLRQWHLLLALTFTVAYLSSEWDGYRWLHMTAGYTFAALALGRLLAGFSRQPGYALTLLPKRLSAATRQLRAQPEQALSGSLPNGLLALSLLALLLLPLPLALAGHFMAEGWIEDVHETLANTVLALVIVHLSTLIWLSVQRRQALHQAMWPVRRATDAAPRRWAAFALVLLTLTGAGLTGWVLWAQAPFLEDETRFEWEDEPW